MNDYQNAALENARRSARCKLPDDMAYLTKVCQAYGVSPEMLIAAMLEHPVTLNFHPDRMSANGRTVLENISEQGHYHSQFVTGTTNGSRTAYAGGARHAWEQKLFGGAYPETALDRPKYGALNVLEYADGAAMRFGSCFMELSAEVMKRCTFCYGDSSDMPRALCTADTFGCIAAEIMRDVAAHQRLLNQGVSNQQDALAMLMRRRVKPMRLGRDLDFCIEAHVHGDVRLDRDVTALYLDSSYISTDMQTQAEMLCARYDIRLNWIPERSVRADAIDELFRGPGIVQLARRMVRSGLADRNINARSIGEASQNSMRAKERWSDIGDDAELFQYFKQLWHYVGYFG